MHLVSLICLVFLLWSPSLFPQALSNPGLGDTSAPANRAPRVHPKSAVLGAVLSLLLPGMGEIYCGHFESGRYFLGAEIASFLGLGMQYLRASSFESDYKVFARTQAGVSGDKDEQFWRDISAFNSVYDFNAERRRNRDFGRLYNPQTHFWQWNSDASRRQFRDLRIQSDKAYQSLYYFLAVMGINRVLSMINTVHRIQTLNEPDELSQNHIEGSLYFLPEHSWALPLPDGLRAELRVSF